MPDLVQVGSEAQWLCNPSFGHNYLSTCACPKPLVASGEDALPNYVEIHFDQLIIGSGQTGLITTLCAGAFHSVQLRRDIDE